MNVIYSFGDSTDSKLMGLFRAVLLKGEYSERVMRLTETLLEMNASNYTIWWMKCPLCYIKLEIMVSLLVITLQQQHLNNLPMKQAIPTWMHQSHQRRLVWGVELHGWVCWRKSQKLPDLAPPQSHCRNAGQWRTWARVLFESDRNRQQELSCVGSQVRLGSNVYCVVRETFKTYMDWLVWYDRYFLLHVWCSLYPYQYQ